MNDPCKGEHLYIQVVLITVLWRWRHFDPPTRWKILAQWYSIISQKTYMWFRFFVALS